MKAVILAGGEGTRLRPMSCHRPKPMVGLLDRPVLEHILLYLRRFGVTEVCVTLKTMPYAIKDYFGDGAPWGLSISYSLESVPLGTAGAVRACEEFLKEEEDFLVISGDAVLDLDIAPCLNLHRTKRADATLVLHRQTSLLEYGLVMTDDDGRVSRFIEKPSWGQVFCDTVNTGIYILSRRAFEKIPQNEFYDFARDLFPKLQAEGAPLYGQAAEGYWCDMGDGEAYRRCCFDALDGRVSLSVPAPEQWQRVWTGSPLPPDIKLIPPCYIGQGVTFGQGVSLGPYAVVGEGSRIGDRARVSHSILDRVRLEEDAGVTGAILCRGTVVRRGGSVLEGAILGDGVVVGEYAVIREGARVWPEKEIETGAHLSGSLVTGHRRMHAVFDGQGRVTGEANVELTPEFCLRLGGAAAELAQGEVGLSYHGGDAARMAALSLEAGIMAVGGRAGLHDADTPACAAFAVGLIPFALGVHVEEVAGQLTLSFFERDGLPLRHALERRLEGTVARGETELSHAAGVGGSRRLGGMGSLYISAAAVPPQGYDIARRVPFSVSVVARHAAAEHLRETLSGIGCRVTSGGGLPQFDIDADGLLLGAIDETGQALSSERLLALVAMLEWEAGRRAVALPYHAPAALDNLAARHRVRLLRVGRDGEDARRLLAATPHLRDGVFAAARLCWAVMKAGGGLAALDARLSPFAVASVEVKLSGDRGAVMRNLAQSCLAEQRELYDGLRARVGEGWVHVAPLPGRRALRITGEGANEEIAAELCDLFWKRAKAVDV